MESRLRAELEQIYRQYRQSLFSLALTVTGCSGLAEDAVHEAFVRMCQKEDRPVGSIVAYVFAAVRNAALDCCRKRVQQAALMESLFCDNKGSAVSNSASIDTSMPELELQSEELKAAIERLDEAVRQIVVMKIFAELTFDEIGEVLTIPSATVATRYRRAIIKLEEQLRRIS